MEISLINSDKKVLIDDSDFGLISRFDWSLCFINNKYYAQTHYCKQTILMHRFILKPTQWQDVDHQDNDGLNNSRGNIRIMPNRTLHHANRVKDPKRTSKYKGVYWNSVKRKWYVYLGYKYKRYFGGTHDNEIEAALSYDRLARKYFKEFARCNFYIT